MDDKEKHLNCVYQAIDLTQAHFRCVTEYVGIRFKSADPIVAKARNRTFRKIVTVQVKAFLEHNVLLEDDHAKEVATKQSRGEKCVYLKPILHGYNLRSPVSQKAEIDLAKPSRPKKRHLHLIKKT